MKDQELTEPFTVSVADSTIALSTTSKSSSTASAADAFNDLCDNHDQSEHTTASLPYSIVCVKYKSVRTILESIDRVSVLFGVQYMFISDGCDDVGQPAEEQTVYMYFQPILSTKTALSDNKIENLSRNLQVSEKLFRQSNFEYTHTHFIR